MDIALSVLRHIEVNHVADAGQSRAASCNVGGDQDIDLPSSGFEWCVRVGLLDIAIDGGGGEATCQQFFREFFSATIGTGKNNHAVEKFRFQNTRQRIELADR